MIPSTSKNKIAQNQRGLFRFWRQHVPHLGMLPQSIYWVTQNIVLSGAQNEKPMQQVQVAIQATLSVGPFAPVDPMVLEASIEERDIV